MSKNILKEQVKELEKLLQLKDRRIKELEDMISNSIMFPKTQNGSISVPSQWTICEHEYPSPWMGTVPPHCTKCGRQAVSFFTITSANNNDSTSGYIKIDRSGYTTVDGTARGK